MTSCPACGTSLEDSNVSACPACGVRLEGATESFAPVPEGSEETGGAAREWAVSGPVLVVRKGPDVGERFFVDRSRLTVGRDPECDIFLNDITVSRGHSVLEFKAGEVSVSDVGSLNGTYVNGVRVDRATLHDGDVVQVGRFQMVFMDRGGS